MNRERLHGMLVLMVALLTILLLLGPLGDLPGVDDGEVEVLDETLER